MHISDLTVCPKNECKIHIPMTLISYLSTKVRNRTNVRYRDIMCFDPLRSFTKLATKTLTWNTQFQIIWNPFYRFGIIVNWNLRARPKWVIKNVQSGNWVNLCSNLITYLIIRLHNWYQGKGQMGHILNVVLRNGKIVACKYVNFVLRFIRTIIIIYYYYYLSIYSEKSLGALNPCR